MMFKPSFQFHTFFLSVTCGLSLIASAADKPNVLVFLVDDMGLMDTSVPFLTDENGAPKTHPLNDFYRTPNMERLAQKGSRYGRFYANSVCSPTRASLMTGQSSARHQTTQWINPWGRNGGPHDPPDWNWEGLNREDVTLPALLKAQGYRTIHCGKGHFGSAESDGADPTKIGFDVNIAGGPIGRPSSYNGVDGFGHIRGTSKKHAVPGLEEYRGKDIHLSEALTLELKKEISNTVEKGQPFFAYMAHYAVHTPFQVDQRFADDYDNKKWKKSQIAYATLIAGMDKSLGDLMDHIDSLGVAENTLILFLGDNGGDAPMGDAHKHGSSAPLRGKKGTHYEGGMRVPFIAAWAKPSDKAEVQKKFPIQANRIQSSALGTIHDVFPTVLQLASVKAPENHVIDGGSLWPVLSGGEPENPQKFLMHFPHSHRSSYFTTYHENHWKLVLHYMKDEKERFELFDLKNDPYENSNVAGKNRVMLSRLYASMRRELADAKAQFPEMKKGGAKAK